MKRMLTVSFALLLFATQVWANGVAIVNGTNETYLRLLSSEVEVTVETQVAITTVTQVYHNDLGSAEHVRYAFPMLEAASATELLWQVNGEWFEANFAPTPQDTTIPGDPGEDPHPDLVTFLGPNPLYFDIVQDVAADSNLVVQLTYVELLPYSFGNVTYRYPNDYDLIQSQPLNYQHLEFLLNSARTIDNIVLLSHTPTTVYNDGYEAFVATEIYESAADDYEVQYALSVEELGLFDFSTYLPDSVVPDDHGGGFFTFIAEPDPSDNVDTIDKVFTLIIDKSGSMSGNKIVQARNAASFIVQHLNEGDRFNLVAFSDWANSFQPDHVDFTPNNESAALSYISELQSGGMTNISGAFSLAVPQFDATDENTANIIIFFTDGQATTGITETQALLQHVEDLVNQTETDVTIFTFGIGIDANTQLLTLLATQHDGIAEFLGNDELEVVITEFYLQIRNPVLLDTEMTFSSPVISETYPDPLPNLYKGQQLIVGGRYTEPAPVTVTLSGTAFGQPISYSYELALADSAVESYQFLTKVWAKLKIEHLLIDYYSYDEGSPEAEAIRAEIIAISLAYGVLSPFTSFDGGDPIAIEELPDDSVVAADDPDGVAAIEVVGNYPNPFNPHTTIRFQVNLDVRQTVLVKIYNLAGQLVHVLAVHVDGPGLYEVTWDGKTSDGLSASTGTYFYVIDYKAGLAAGKMTLLK